MLNEAGTENVFADCVPSGSEFFIFLFFSLYITRFQITLQIGCKVLNIV